MASSSSTSTKFIIALIITFNLLFVSQASFAEPPSFYAHPPSYADLPKLCNFDDAFKYGDQVFHDIERCNVGLLRACKVDKIYQLGDSISDVGNLIHELPVGAATTYARLPYGNNFPTGPTGRASNGNLMIDYFAMDAGLPLLPPFKKSDGDFSHGVNFAMTGSTALPWNVLATLNISTPITTNSLSVQLDWMSAYFDSICHNQRDCGGKHENTIFILGPFGGSDYHNALFQGKSFHEIETTLVPKVMDAIMAAVRRVISLGARKVVVPGIYTISLLPIYRQTFPEDTWEVSEDLAIYHNIALQAAINKLNQEEKHDAIVIYGDYYSAFRALETYGVGANMNLMVCCGSGDAEHRNFDLGRMCGAEGVSACSEPKKSIHWDGLHLTEEAYRIMTKYLLFHIFMDLQCPYH